ncbi:MULTISPECIES: peptidylprolyl isomerase [unclassified Leptolyngbya]|uniref:peptidylprolyl isomerase n=1 Tax=unclassified Leptolyngbya TaxID=2650499 RepID=UPI00168692EA|nr:MULTISPECIES: peptidylprolyl isomerase [unclassified Leptolyngbya]MBD1911231.1 peptidylprolyl isomerase [Leptolyngbya sp. FACHB-8]MBD2155478.1 peptidylprolyl isomerase [Leptolyngbya sp. FACHB-16]
MTSETFLTIDDTPITISQIFRYLQASRKLEPFIGDLVRQFVLERELQRQDLQISPAAVEQAVIDFRLQQKLVEPQQFQNWLTENNTTFEAFYAQIANNFRLQKLKEISSEPRLQDYFIERKIYLDRVVLSRLIVDNAELADELKSQLAEGASFEQLVREYSVTDDRVMNGMLGPVSRGSMPDVLRAAIDLAKPGDVIGPLELEGRWGLFRIEDFLPASLENPQLQQTLRDELFEQWLNERMQQLPIRIQIGEPQPEPAQIP